MRNVFIAKEQIQKQNFSQRHLLWHHSNFR